jgi:hypothetical protein
MKILLHSSGRVDLEAPICMTPEQYHVFEDFFKKNFHDIEFVNRIEKIKKIGANEGEHKDWTLEDHVLLLKPVSNSVLAAKMGRTEMGVKMKRGHFVPDFFVWMQKKGYSLPVVTSTISDFFREQEGK